jgi:uncharacterized protein YyaL (SSP411 family)
MSHNTEKTTGRNRLINEKSPYLLQHAHNPVDWFPWGREAFEKAQSENKPIFLSIGYSTCHWCHVMEKESFEDKDVADLINDTFVSIKVDREERPDIDNVYMAVCQLMTNRGGWPLTIMMTPDRKPFFAATYLPKQNRFGQMGMLELISRIRELWGKDVQKIRSSANEITKELVRLSHILPGEGMGETALHRAYEQLLHNFDWQYGGFGVSPKFPSPHQLTFLLRYWKRTGHEDALTMVDKTLQAMHHGGIYDHVGYGFHRYATDQKWILPHFEKMLYDQALLSIAYTEAYQVKKREDYKRVTMEILEYVARDMTSPEGGFYSAEDADSEGDEGKFYIWNEEEIRSLIPEEDVNHILKAFNVRREGNFTDEGSGLQTGKNVIHLGRSEAEIANGLNISTDKLIARINRTRRLLFDERKERIHPHKDDKILTDWNGLMIAAYSMASQVFDNEEYRDRAERAVTFIFEKLCDSEKQLFHRFRGGEASIPAFLDDYAFLVWGLIELYEVSFEESYLQRALDLNNKLLQKFWDEKDGGFFFTADSSENILLRRKELYDGAIPSGNSIAMLNLLRLSRMTGNSELEEKAEQMGRLFSQSLSALPSAHTSMLAAVDFALGPSWETVIVGEPGADDTKEMIKVLRSQFTPNNVILFVPHKTKLSDITRIAYFTEKLSAIEGKSTAYVCRNYQCSLPTTDTEKMLQLLNTP